MVLLNTVKLFECPESMDEEEWQAVQEMFSMELKDLLKIDHTIKKWVCQVKGCNTGTLIRDFGISPFYHVLRKGWGWYNLEDNFLMCHTHLKFVKKMELRFDKHHIFERLMSKERAIDRIKEQYTK